jgi:hypothetical protein
MRRHYPGHSRLVPAAALALALALGCGDDDGPVNPQRSIKNVTVAGGAGSGRVTAAFDSGAVATLTATADAGQEFIAWSGDCTGSSCQLTVTRDLSASARFAALQAPLTMELITPNGDDGAILFAITGPSILGVTPSAGLELVESRATSSGMTTSTIVVRGNLSSGILGQIAVRGLDLDAPYTVQIREAAARGSGGYAQRTDLSAYRVTIQR